MSFEGAAVPVANSVPNGPSEGHLHLEPPQQHKFGAHRSILNRVVAARTLLDALPQDILSEEAEGVLIAKASLVGEEEGRI